MKLPTFGNWVHGLNEAMKTEADIPPGVCLYYHQNRGDLEIWFGHADTQRELPIDKLPDDIEPGMKRPRSAVPAGKVYCQSVDLGTDEEWDAYRNEDGDADRPVSVLMVHAVDANGGWGPLLYEIAMEMASRYDEGGLISDRSNTDSLAMPIWRAFYRRSDIRKIPLPEDHHTDQQGYFSDEDLHILNHRYMKVPDTRCKALEARGLLKRGSMIDRWK